MPPAKRFPLRLHWPSWLTLLAVAGTFVALNLVVNFTPKGSNLGWPFRYCRVNSIRTIGDPHWAWSAKFEEDGSAPRYNWIKGMLMANGLVGIVWMILATIGAESQCRRHKIRLTMRTLLFAMGVVAATLVILAPTRFPNFTFNSGFVGSLMAVLCVAAGLAGLGIWELVHRLAAAFSPPKGDS